MSEPMVMYYDSNSTLSEDAVRIPLWEALTRIHPLAAVHWDRDGLQWVGRPLLVRRWVTVSKNHPDMIAVVVAEDPDAHERCAWYMLRNDLTWHREVI